MGHEIHFMGNLPRTDLALDLIDENQTMEGFTKKVKQYNHCKVTWVNITNEGSKKISKKAGYYITIEFDDVTDHENEQEVFENSYLAEQMKKGVHEKDLFHSNHPETNWESQIEHGEEIGLGTKEYELIEVK